MAKKFSQRYTTNFVRRVESDFKARMGATYDGILGDPPSWVPRWHRNEFWRTRDSVISNYPLDKVRRWFELEMSSGESGCNEKPKYNVLTGRYYSIEHAVEIRVTVPKDALRLVSGLATLYRVINSGEEHGLVVFAGKHALDGRRQVNRINKGREDTYGTLAERKKKQLKIRAEVGRLKALHPNDSMTKIFDEVGPIFKLKRSAIRRYYKDDIRE